MEERVYIVVLRNLDLPDRKLCMTSGRIASHAVHVGAVLTRASGLDVADMDVIILSVANNEELDVLCKSLACEGVAFVEYRDTDRVIEGEYLTAIATYPIANNSSPSLKKLSPWKCACNEVRVSRSSVAERLVDNQDAESGHSRDVGSIPSGRASIL